MNDRLEAFTRDLKTLSSLAVIRRHMFSSPPMGLTYEVYSEIREKIAERFGVHPTSVMIVGSCQLGFSLKKRKEGRYRSFSTDSDIDVAVVSSELFDSYWDSVFEVIRSNRDWALEGGRLFARDLFCGWVSPDNLPNDPRLAKAREWSEFFDTLSRSRICGYRRMCGRLYKNWYRLEAYQRRLVEECQAEATRA